MSQWMLHYDINSSSFKFNKKKFIVFMEVVNIDKHEKRKFSTRKDSWQCLGNPFN